jgi:hypothetical protein|tara:strand:+ start:1340 stop:1480 length:141 start_codon:yes stop_codon:yes gene_type:complete
MFYKLSRYLTKKGISDLELIKILGILGMGAFVMGAMLYGAIGALIL